MRLALSSSSLTACACITSCKLHKAPQRLQNPFVQAREVKCLILCDFAGKWLCCNLDLHAFSQEQHLLLFFLVRGSLCTQADLKLTEIHLPLPLGLKLCTTIPGSIGFFFNEKHYFHELFGSGGT
ncbi:mCG1040684 [Mus musculus]|nr:mCG1040684 [Mus musculus]